VTIYQLALVATLLPLAALGEIVGQRRVHLGGLILFIAASLGCAMAWSLPSLMIARALQGLGASAVMAANVALIRFIYPSDKLGRGIGLNALVVGVSFVVGPTVASAILLVAHWPSLFAVNVPIGLAGLALVWTSLPETDRADRAFDWLAARWSMASNGGPFASSGGTVGVHHQNALAHRARLPGPQAGDRA
jgi:MFS transporter, DHA2 family, multidrug resistance protein